MFSSYEVLGGSEYLRIASLAVGIVFAYAAAMKMYDFSGFVIGIRGYKIVPVSIATWIASSIVLGESAIALAHLFGLGLRLLLPVAIVFLLVFLVFTLRSLKLGDGRPCLCFGANRHDTADAFGVIRLFILLSVEIVLFSREFSSVGRDVVSVASNLYEAIGFFSVAVLATTLFGWFLTPSKFLRAWRVVRT